MEIVNVGLCQEGNHDKVWGVILLVRDMSAPFMWKPNKYAIFWGRCGCKLQTKIFYGSSRQVNDFFHKKLNKGYKKINPDELDRVYPEFSKDLEKTAIWAILKS